MQRQLALLLIFVIATHSISSHAQPSCWERARATYSVFGAISAIAALLSCLAKPLPKKATKPTPKERKARNNNILALTDQSDEMVQRRFFPGCGSGSTGWTLLDRSDRYTYKMDSLQCESLPDSFIQIQLLDPEEPDSWGVGLFDDSRRPTGAIDLHGLPEGLFAVSETVFFVFYQNIPFLSFFDLDLQRLIWETPIRGYLKILELCEERLYIIFEGHSCDSVQVYQRRPFKPLTQISVEHGRITSFHVENGLILVLYNGLTLRIFNEMAVLRGLCSRWITLKDLPSKAVRFKYDGKHITYTHEDGTETIIEITLLPPTI